MKIKAYGVKEKGGSPEPFYYESTIGKNDVFVKITHCSMARGDIQFLNDDWGDAKFPVVPGHEIVGIVDSTGSNVNDLKPGDRVGIGYRSRHVLNVNFARRVTNSSVRIKK